MVSTDQATFHDPGWKLLTTREGAREGGKSVFWGIDRVREKRVDQRDEEVDGRGIGELTGGTNSSGRSETA